MRLENPLYAVNILQLAARAKMKSVTAIVAQTALAVVISGGSGFLLGFRGWIVIDCNRNCSCLTLIGSQLDSNGLPGDTE